MILNGEVSNYKKEKRYSFHTNCYWVEINNKEKEVVFKRELQQENWLDEKHTKIINALEALEKALLEVVEE